MNPDWSDEEPTFSLEFPSSEEDETEMTTRSTKQRTEEVIKQQTEKTERIGVETEKKDIKSDFYKEMEGLVEPPEISPEGTEEL
ncbi:GM16137 [Drosophila sechellia]|uniref:GM16137 n=1 Tax=Drosophila sechellia TaxID=7238 RepID=B4ILE9_DROSE|nr:GM22056 [Drosophila sechellia]EDW53812.1 GM16137 [Drosophila sechellia]